MGTVYNSTVAYTFSIRDRDLDERSTTLNYQLTDTATLAAIIGFADDIGEAIDNITDGLYLGCSISINTRESPAPSGLAPETSEVQRKGLFSFFNVGGGVSSIQIPSIDPALVIDETKRIDTSNAAVQAFIDIVLNGPLGLGNGAATATGLQFEALKEARKINLKDSKKS